MTRGDPITDNEKTIGALKVTLRSFGAEVCIEGTKLPVDLDAEEIVELVHFFDKHIRLTQCQDCGHRRPLREMTYRLCHDCRPRKKP